MMETKVCVRCQRMLPLDCFYRQRYKGMTYIKNTCKNCYNQKTTERRFCTDCERYKPLNKFTAYGNEGKYKRICKACEAKRRKEKELAMKGVEFPELDERISDNIFRISVQGGKYIAEAKLIYIGEEDYWRWETLKEFKTEFSALNYLKRCQRMSTEKLKNEVNDYKKGV